MQWHGLAYGFFASIVAPFGGFFASAIKRAYKKKDFDSFMPGHGGMMDRMDCQLMMITFNSFYYNHFISTKTYGIDKLLVFAAALTTEQQMELWTEVSIYWLMCSVIVCAHLHFFLCICFVYSWVRSWEWLQRRYVMLPNNKLMVIARHVSITFIHCSLSHLDSLNYYCKCVCSFVCVLSLVVQLYIKVAIWFINP